MRKIDTIDRQLVQLVVQDARQNSEEMARQLGLSSATIRRRLRTLIRSGVLRIIGIVDRTSFGFPVIAMINLDIAHDNIKAALDELAKRPEVSFVSTVTGRYDVVALAEFHSNELLSEFLTKVVAKLEGMRHSETFICLDVKKMTQASITLSTTAKETTS